MRRCRFNEAGSVTLVGIWMMGFLLLVSAVFFVYGDQEVNVSNLERESYHRQLFAESLLEKHLLLLQQDFSQVEKILALKDYVQLRLAKGEEGQFIYNVKAIHDEAGKVLIAAAVYNKADSTDENMFFLRWHLEVDKDEQTVVRSGIG